MAFSVSDLGDNEEQMMMVLDDRHTTRAADTPKMKVTQSSVASTCRSGQDTSGNQPEVLDFKNKVHRVHFLKLHL